MSFALSRSNDPVTSRKAARKMGSTNDAERLIVNALLEHGPMTTHRISALLGMTVVSVSPRIKPMRKKLLVENSGMVEFGRSVWRALPQQPGLLITTEMLNEAEERERLAPYSRAPKFKDPNMLTEARTRIDVSAQSMPDPEVVPDLTAAPDMHAVGRMLASLPADLQQSDENSDADGEEEDVDSDARGRRVFDSFLTPHEKELMAAQTAADNQLRADQIASVKESVAHIDDLFSIRDAKAANTPDAEIIDPVVGCVEKPVRKHRKKEPVIGETHEAESIRSDHELVMPSAGSSSSEIKLNITITLKIDVSSNGVKISMVH